MARVAFCTNHIDTVRVFTANLFANMYKHRRFCCPPVVVFLLPLEAQRFKRPVLVTECVRKGLVAVLLGINRQPG